MARKYSNDIVKLQPVAAEVEIDTPMGPKVATIGKFGRSYFEITYRSQDLSAQSLEKLRKDIEKVEADFQTKKIVEKKRREVAKTPEEATLFTPAGRRVREVRDSKSFRGFKKVYVDEPAGFEEIKIRGVDQRSGNALVTMADGTNQPLSWGLGGRFARRTGYIGTGSVILRPLEQEERADILAANKAVERAEQRRVEVFLPSVNKVLDDAYGEDYQLVLDLAYDLEAGRFYAEHEGVRHWGADDREVLSGVLVALLREQGYLYRAERSGGEVEPLEGLLDLWTSQSVVRTPEEAQVYEDAQKAAADAKDVLSETVDQYLFDQSLVAIPQDEPEPEEPAEDAVSLPDVRAPHYDPEWDADNS